MAKNIVVVSLLLVLALFAVGCAQDTGNYQPPSGPIGGGCGIQAPVEETASGAAVSVDAGSSAVL